MSKHSSISKYQYKLREEDANKMISASYTYTMLDGWNLIGGKDASGTEAIAQFLQDQEAESAWDWSEDDRTWKSFIIGVPDFINSLNEMSVDSGYFIYKAPPESSSE